jgi:hypothetical protein
MAVTVFDFLDRSAGTATTDFEVLQVRYPEISLYSPHSFMLNIGKPLEIAVEGDNFTDESLFFLSREAGDGQTSGRRIPGENVQVSANGRRVTFTAPTAGLAVASYRIVVENPGGIVVTSDPIRFGLIPERPAYLSLGYAPFVPLGGYLFEDFAGFHPIGFTLHASYLFLPLGSTRLGLEFASSLAMLKASTQGVEDALTVDIGVNIVGQWTLDPRRFYVNARLGAGVMFMNGFVYPVDGINDDHPDWPARSEPEFLWAAAMTFGGSAVWTFTEHFFAEAGVEVSLAFDRAAASLYLRPTLSLGYRFSNVVRDYPTND